MLTTPWSNARVTISPLATWLTSWPEHGLDLTLVEAAQKPVLTATSALFRLMPVAKAFGSEES